jgi:hypothetical protein
MRRTRWLFLAAIVAVIFAVSVSFIKRREILERDPRAQPKPLEAGVEGRAPNWEHTEFKGDKKHYTVRARNFRQIKEPSVVELEASSCSCFARRRKVGLDPLEKAQFDMAAKTLFSDGDVDITMGVPGGQPTGLLAHPRLRDAF